MFYILEIWKTNFYVYGKNNQQNEFPTINLNIFHYKTQKYLILPYKQLVIFDRFTYKHPKCSEYWQ